jgi:indoleamine 2,3-dioxygenase
LIYEGVDDYANKPQEFRGETGAQSSIVPAIDAVLGIEHQPDPLREYLMEMRAYMPPEHRSFIEGLEAQPSVRAAVEAEKGTYPALREAYNTCVYFMQEFRSKHLELAARYIHQQSQRSLANPTEVGTGGTPFMRYLKKHRDETAGHHLDQSSGSRSA